MSSSVIFDWFGIRAKEGSFVPLVVWANFVCGILYLITAFGILQNQFGAKFPLLIALIILILAYIGLFIHINNGGLYEAKTIGAMAFRIFATGTFLILALKISKK